MTGSVSPWCRMSVVVTFSTNDPGQWSIPGNNSVMGSKIKSIFLVPFLSSSGGVVHVQKWALIYKRYYNFLEDLHHLVLLPSHSIKKISPVKVDRMTNTAVIFPKEDGSHALAIKPQV